MKTIVLVVIGLGMACLWGARALAQEQGHGAAAAAAGHEAAAPEATPHDGAPHEGAAHAAGSHDAGPVPPASPQRWPKLLLVLIGVMFVGALAVALIAGPHAPPELPPTHSHDEPPGASHHHGHGGTINPVPEDVARVEGHGHDHGPDHGHGH